MIILSSIPIIKRKLKGHKSSILRQKACSNRPNKPILIISDKKGEVNTKFF